VSVAYQLALKAATADTTTPTTITILEAIQPASAASGKGGGFMARSWGNGSPTQRLHELSFDMYEQLAANVQCTSYRKLPVLSVAPGNNRKGKKNPQLADIMPGWLDETAVGRVSAMGFGDDTAQITPKEFVDCMLASADTDIKVVMGVCTGIATEVLEGSESGTEKVTGVQYRVAGNGDDNDDTAESNMLPADAVIVAAGPWSCAAEDWFHGAVQLPMEGIKSTSIVWKKPEEVDVDATALFCGEDDRFGTHLEVYPRPDGTIYICGIGGSDYISKDDLKEGAFRGASCQPNEARVEAAKASFQEMSSVYKESGELDRAQGTYA
jgi:glycine/D-amino acid oxidase-like deaminating enzyme